MLDTGSRGFEITGSKGLRGSARGCFGPGTTGFCAWLIMAVKKLYIIRRRNMKFFIDTANVDDIRKANDMGIICGVTTNPSLIAKEGRDFNQVIAEIASIVDGPISGEVKATDRKSVV